MAAISVKCEMWLVLVLGLFSSDFCCGAKLERKQDYFDVESFDTKRDYGLNEIGKRGFTSNLGLDYSTSSEYGIGGTSVVTTEYPGGRSGSSAESLSPARDLIPPPVRGGAYSSSTSPPTTRSDYSDYRKFSGISSPSSKEFHSPYRSQLSRRSPSHIHQTPSSHSHYHDDDDIRTSAATNRGGSLNPGNFGLVADTDGKLIGYRGSILPGYAESHQSIISSSSPSPDQDNFIGGYFPGSDYPKPKYSLASSSASRERYTSTPVYYPGREEDNTYRMRDTTSQGYGDDEELSPSSEDSDFTIGGSSTYQPPPLPSPPSSHAYHSSRESERLMGHSHLDSNRYVPFGRERDHSPSSVFSYGPLGQNHRLSPYEFNRRSYGSRSATSNYDHHSGSTLERSPTYSSYSGLGYNEYGSH